MQWLHCFLVNGQNIFSQFLFLLIAKPLVFKLSFGETAIKTLKCYNTQDILILAALI